MKPEVTLYKPEEMKHRVSSKSTKKKLPLNNYIPYFITKVPLNV